jgi:hypothetical protein
VSKSLAQFRLQQDWSKLDPSYKDVYLNVIPAVDFEVKIEEKRGNDAEEEYTDIKEPLIKCEADDPEVKKNVRGYRSGKRSAVLTTEAGDKIRLKGCGNLTGGFPL